MPTTETRTDWALVFLDEEDPRPRPPHICVVMIVHNRKANVRRALHAWSLQSHKDFSIVVADDGSTENILGLVKRYEDDLNIWYYRQLHVDESSVAVNINQGSRVVPQKTTHIWYTDGDIIRDKDAMENAYKHIEEYPGRVIIGRYDWLPAMVITPMDIENSFQKIIDCELPLLEGDGQVRRRLDHRLRRADCFDHNLLPSSAHILGANFIIPVQAFSDVGGWDEHIPGSNANDGDFGWMLTQAGYGSLAVNDITGYHMWHPRDPEALTEGTGIALIYLFRKRGVPVPDYYKPFIPKERQWRKDHGWPAPSDV